MQNIRILIQDTLILIHYTLNLTSVKRIFPLLVSTKLPVRHSPSSTLHQISATQSAAQPYTISMPRFIYFKFFIVNYFLIIIFLKIF